MMIYRKLAQLAIVGFSVIALASVGSSAAQANLVQNGDFNQFTINGTTPNGQPGELGSGTGYTTLSDWTYLNPTKSYDFLFTSNSNGTDADTTGSWNPTGGGHGGYLKLWGTNDGGLDPITASPVGGNFLGVDPVYDNSSVLSQTLTGLTVGEQYTVSFYDAAAEQYPYTGASYDQWKVSLGNQTQLANYISLPSKSFSGWFKESLNFTATSTSEALSFLATGGPTFVQPPFVLLDGVSVTATDTPEPSSIFGLGAVMILGLGAGFQAKLASKQ